MTSFSDLGPGVGAEQRDPTPTGAEIEVDLESDFPGAEQRDPTPTGAEIEVDLESDVPVAVSDVPVAESDVPVAESDERRRV